MKKGFTLSEILVTLGIVGIVAVLTVPGVMKNYANRMYTTQLQKVYTQLSDAVQAIMNDEHVDNFYETSVSANCTETGAYQKNCTIGHQGFLNRYIKSTKKNCGPISESITGTCVSSNITYRAMNNAALTPVNVSYYCTQTTSGAAICAPSGVNDVAGRPVLSLIVDVNGLAQPNVAGRDIFAMDIRQDGNVVDYGTGGQPESTGSAASTCGTGTGTMTIQSASKGCLNNIIDSGWKMEY